MATKLVQMIGVAIALWPRPAIAQPLFEQVHDWTVEVGEQTYGVIEWVQLGAGFRRTTVFLGPYSFSTNLRAVVVGALAALVPLALGAGAFLATHRRKEPDSKR